MTYDILQSSTQSALMFFLVQTSDHITGLTGASPTVTISKNGGSFGSPSGAVTEVANGWYKVAGNATDTNTLGPLALHATATSGDPCDILVANIVSYNPQSATNLGLSGLPTANPGAANGVLIAGSNAATTISGLTLTGAAAVTSTPATAGLTVTGGAASTTGGGTAAPAATFTGGAGASSTNGAASGVTLTGGGTNTVASNAHGLSITGASTGNGLLATSGAGSTGDGIGAAAASTNGNGVAMSGVGTGTGLKSTGGATGNGITVVGGATSGDGINITTTSGHGITATAAGTAKHGINATGAAASGGNAAGTGITATGGAATTSSGGTAGQGMKVVGGAGAASTNGAAAGITATAGGTTTVSGSDGVIFTGTGNGNGITGAHAGSGLDLNCTTSPPLQVNATQINGVSTSSVTTINANQGTTQPINFTGTGSSALVKSDIQDIAGSPVSTSSAQIGVNVVNAGGTAWASGSLTSGVFASGAINAASINADTGLIIRANTAQAVASGSITLDAGASSTNDYYKDSWVVITGGTTGVGQVRRISGYTGSTQVATVSPAWSATPTGTIKFAILPFGRVDLDAILGSASAGAAGYAAIDWSAINAPTSTQNLTGTTISTSQQIASVSGAVGSVTGNVGGNVAGSVASVAGNVAGSVNSVTTPVAITSNRKKGSSATFEAIMQNSTTGAPQTGLTVSSTISKDGGSPGSTTNSVTEVGSGQYQLVLTATEMNANNIVLEYSATGAVTTCQIIQTQP